jgi:hypothetical protein
MLMILIWRRKRHGLGVVGDDESTSLHNIYMLRQKSSKKLKKIMPETLPASDHRKAPGPKRDPGAFSSMMRWEAFISSSPFS